MLQIVQPTSTHYHHPEFVVSLLELYVPWVWTVYSDGCVMMVSYRVFSVVVFVTQSCLTFCDPRACSLCP